MLIFERDEKIFARMMVPADGSRTYCPISLGCYRGLPLMMLRLGLKMIGEFSVKTLVETYQYAVIRSKQGMNFVVLIQLRDGLTVMMSIAGLKEVEVKHLKRASHFVACPIDKHSISCRLSILG